MAPIPEDGVPSTGATDSSGTAPFDESRGGVAGFAVVPAPPHAPTAAELATPESAMRAWLSRWCPFHHTDDFGTAEARARAAMTADGWRSFDPLRSAPARSSWERTVAARETGQCAAPTAQISPGAPRTDTDSIVIGSIDRLVTHAPRPAAGNPGAAGRAGFTDGYVETVAVVQVVRRGPDGLWRVDLPTAGG